ncbi:efflux RND transporter periplasmic adaptor subunit [Lentisphaera profundi]|uniref:Efflux RND transporter periplasmic adaptor subunit n=1 Tax=Lentisphaera profundi TaxID=1658616 RepID=A0ABY7W4B8_9BACT|nr:efflux RND transporter periplasmic adaptor subunit [Lentisphaera profundi]WDE99088.1 efflux RND transporter periplasmic adaptor subunit [Lentisphaera profundi]
MENISKSRRLILLGLIVLLFSCAEEKVQKSAPIPKVVYEEARAMSVTPTTVLVGRVRSFSSVDLRARVEGVLESRHFETGTAVKKGDLLYTIEKDTYEINLKRTQAELESAQARFTLAQSIFVRMKNLNDKKAIAKQDFDKSIGERDAAAAAFHLAEAQHDEAKLHLEWCEIKSPIDGVPGARRYDTGNLISPSSGVLVNVISTKTMEVDFDVSEQRLVGFQRQYAAKNVRRTIFDRIKAELSLPDKSIYEHEGKISYFDNRINKSTGTIKATTHFANPEGLLKDGMFVKVHLTYVPPAQDKMLEGEKKKEKRIVITQSAVMQDQAGHYVIAISDDNKAQVKRVEFKESFEEYFVITSGLKEGDKVITLGLQTVIPGNAVEGIPAEVDVPVAIENVEEIKPEKEKQDSAAEKSVKE